MPNTPVNLPSSHMARMLNSRRESEILGSYAHFFYHKYDSATRLVILPRDVQTLYAYWEVSLDTWREVIRIFSADIILSSRKPVLRFYSDQNGLKFVFDREIQLTARNWHGQVLQQPLLNRAELGLILSDGRFVLLAISNRFQMPAGHLSGNGSK